MFMLHHMQAEELLGSCSLYTVIEWAREQLPHWSTRLASAVKQDETPEKEELPVQVANDEDAEVNSVLGSAMQVIVRICMMAPAQDNYFTLQAHKSVLSAFV